jgi:hypothetical protein
MNMKSWFRPKRNLHPQPVSRQALDHHRCLFRLAVQPQRVVMGEDKEIRQPFALCGQQRGPHGTAGPNRFDVVGNQALQKRDAILALSRDDASFG